MHSFSFVACVSIRESIIFFIILRVVVLKKVLFLKLDFAKHLVTAFRTAGKTVRLSNNNKINSSSLLFKYVFHI